MDVLTTPKLPLADWLAIVEREYLAAFIPEGGAAAKVAVLEPAEIGAAGLRLAALGRAHGMLTVSLDAGQTRINLMHELFFAISRALPWDDLLQYYVEGLFTAQSYAWPRPGAAMTMTELADSFGVAPRLLTRHCDQWLTADLWEDRALAQDFRAALLRLCVSRLALDGTEEAGPARGWLLGEKVSATLLRSADISVRISRTNARAMLSSLCHFVRKAGAAGLLLAIDVQQLARTAVEEGTLRYSPAAVMDTYEVLREIIDGADHLPGLFTAVLASAEIATGDPRRTLSQYAALQMRVWPDVRPGDRQNPLAPLVWLGA